MHEGRYTGIFLPSFRRSALSCVCRSVLRKGRLHLRWVDLVRPCLQLRPGWVRYTSVVDAHGAELLAGRHLQYCGYSHAPGRGRTAGSFRSRVTGNSSAGNRADSDRGRHGCQTQCQRQVGAIDDHLGRHQRGPGGGPCISSGLGVTVGSTNTVMRPRKPCSRDAALRG